MYLEHKIFLKIRSTSIKNTFSKKKLLTNWQVAFSCILFTGNRLYTVGNFAKIPKNCEIKACSHN